MKRKRSKQLDLEIAEALRRTVHSTQLADWWRKTTPTEDRVCCLLRHGFAHGLVFGAELVNSDRNS